MAVTGRSRRKTVVRAIAGLMILGIALIGAWAFPTVRTLLKTGFFETLSGDRKYTGDTVADLTAIRKAMMLYHDSEGAFPPAEHWMEAIHQHIRTDDMSANEADKKFIDPVNAGQTGKYGFAFNDAAAGKYKDDIKDPKTPLIFESQDPSRDAHGDPAKLAPNPAHAGGNLAIAVDGTILHLPN